MLLNSDPNMSSVFNDLVLIRVRAYVVLIYSDLPVFLFFRMILLTNIFVILKNFQTLTNTLQYSRRYKNRAV